MPKDTHVENSFSFLLWKMWLTFHNKKMPKDTDVKKSFLFLLWKMWLTLHNKKIPKETHVENSFSFLLWKMWKSLHNYTTREYLKRLMWRSNFRLWKLWLTLHNKRVKSGSVKWLSFLISSEPGRHYLLFNYLFSKGNN